MRYFVMKIVDVAFTLLLIVNCARRNVIAAYAWGTEGRRKYSCQNNRTGVVLNSTSGYEPDLLPHLPATLT